MTRVSMWVLAVSVVGSAGLALASYRNPRSYGGITVISDEFAMKTARDGGEAFKRFLSNYDVEIPMNFSASLLRPYFSLPHSFDQFHFAYAGPMILRQLDNPEDVMVGYCENTRGRAVVYVDGSVRWVEARK